MEELKSTLLSSTMLRRSLLFSSCLVPILYLLLIHGRSTAGLELLQAPDNFTLLSEVDYKTVVVSWNPVPPESLRGKFEGYKVEHWTDDDDVQEVFVNNNATQTVVEDLVPFAKNYLRVRAYNTDHDGPPSRTVEVVMEEGVPGPVGNFEAFPLGMSSFYLAWDKPERPNGILRGYEIYFLKVVGTDVGQKMQRGPGIDDPEQTFAKLSGLERGTRYRIQVHAMTRQGEGEAVYTEQRTEESPAIQLAKPRFSWSQGYSESGVLTIRVYWKPSLVGDGSPGSHFYVQYRKYGETTFQSTEPQLYEDFQDIRGLDPGETYVFRVVAVEGQLSKISESEEIDPHPLEPLQAPGNFTLLSEVDYKTVVVSWNPVPPDSLRGKFEGYKVERWTDDDGVRQVFVNNNATQAVVEDLVPFVRNYLRVRAYNTEYDGPASHTVEFFMEEGVPGPVELFEAFPLGMSSLYLAWEKPKRPNGILRGYEIYYQKVVGTELGQKMQRSPGIDDPEQTVAKLTGLERGTKYRIHIHAMTRQGEGEGSYTEQRTEESPAAQLAQPRFSWSEEGFRTIRVYWKPNLEGDGRPGSHFYVQYKKFRETTFNSTEPQLYEVFQDVEGLETGEHYVFQIVVEDGQLNRTSESKIIYIWPPACILYSTPHGTIGGFFGLVVALTFFVLILTLVYIIKRNRRASVLCTRLPADDSTKMKGASENILSPLTKDRAESV